MDDLSDHELIAIAEECGLNRSRTLTTIRETLQAHAADGSLAERLRKNSRAPWQLNGGATSEEEGFDLEEIETLSTQIVSEVRNGSAVSENVRFALRVLHIGSLKWALDKYGIAVRDRRSRTEMERVLSRHYTSFDMLLNDLVHDELVDLAETCGLPTNGNIDELRKRLRTASEDGTLRKLFKVYFEEEGGSPEQAEAAEWEANHSDEEYLDAYEPELTETVKCVSDREILRLILSSWHISLLRGLCRLRDRSPKDRRSREPMEAALVEYYGGVSENLLRDLSDYDLRALAEAFDLDPANERALLTKQIIEFAGSFSGRRRIVGWLSPGRGAYDPEWRDYVETIRKSADGSANPKKIAPVTKRFDNYEPTLTDIASRMTEQRVLQLALLGLHIRLIRRLCRLRGLSSNDLKSRKPMEAALVDYYKRLPIMLQDFTDNELESLTKQLELKPVNNRALAIQQITNFVSSLNGRKLLLYQYVDEADWSMYGEKDIPRRGKNTDENSDGKNIKIDELNVISRIPEGFEDRRKELLNSFQQYLNKRLEDGSLTISDEDENYCSHCHGYHKRHWIDDEWAGQRFYICVRSGEPMLVINKPPSSKLMNCTTTQYMTEYNVVSTKNRRKSPWVILIDKFSRYSQYVEIEFTALPVPSVALKVRKEG